MKIGIITLPTRTNYGGILQAFALAKTIQKLGHDPKVIYLPVKWELSWYRKPYIYTKRLLNKFLNNDDSIVFLEDKLNNEFPIVSKYTWEFVEMNTPHMVINRYEDIKRYEFDAFIVGSDQIWRPKYIPNNIENAFLSFAQGWNVKRIAYSVSFGTDKWEYTNNQTAKCKKLAKLFDAVSVREKSGIKLCHDYLEITAKLTLDPSLLLSKEDYLHIINNDTLNHSHNLLVYILDDNDKIKNIIDNIAKRSKLFPIKVNSNYENPYSLLEERIQPSVERWLSGFYHSEMIVTDSFHACAFSIIFNKPFWVIGNEARGMARFESLLSLFGLEDRLIFCTSEIKDNNIDWDKVNDIRKNMINDSIAYFKQLGL